jgi:putative acetyltransferase
MCKKLIIRRYRPGEEDDLRTLYAETTRIVNGRDYTSEQVEHWVLLHADAAKWRERIRNRNPFVAEESGNILGFAELTPDGQIDYFYCHHRRLRQGVGRSLYQAIESEAQRLELSCLRAAVSVTAKPFFLAMGFQVVKEQRNVVCGAVAPNSIMEKRLADDSPTEGDVRKSSRSTQSLAADVPEGQTMNIRPYETDDWAAVCDIWNRGKPDEFRGTCDLRAIVPLEQDASMQKLFHESTVFVGEVTTSIVGFAGFRGDVITWLFIDPQSYRSGYGTALLTFVLERIGARARLNVGAGNTAAIRLYEKHGFAITKRFEGNYNGFPTKAIRMERTTP